MPSCSILPVVHHGEAVAHRERLLLVVRDVDERQPDLLLQRLELDLERAPQLGVQRAERLVEQHDGGLEHERARQRDALLLAAGELRGLAPLQAGELHQLDGLGDAPARLAPVDTGALEPERDVVGDVAGAGRGRSSGTPC